MYDAWRDDIDVRTTGTEHLLTNGYRVHVHEIREGVVYDSGGGKVTALRVLHGSWKDSFGYRVDTPDRSIVISGDTRPSLATSVADVGTTARLAFARGARLAPSR